MTGLGPGPERSGGPGARPRSPGPRAAPPDHHLLYDADCGLCRAITGVVLWLDRDRRLRPVALQSPEAPSLLPGLSAEQRLASFHLVSPPGRVSSAGPALAELASVLRDEGRGARALARRPAIARRGYDLVARNRSRLGALVPRWWRVWADRQIAQRT